MPGINGNLTERARRRNPGRAALALAGFALLLGAPDAAFAAKVQVGDSTGGTPTPIDGSDLMVSFNPTATVTVQFAESIDEVLEDLAAAINATSGTVYTATVPDPTTLEIRRGSGEEIDDLHFTDDDAGIQSVLLTVDRPNLSAYLGLVAQTPSSGSLIVTLNGRRLVVPTTGRTAAGLNAALIQAIRGAGFLVEEADPYLIVRRDLRLGTALTQVGLWSTDPVLTVSDLALLPGP
jgi:hypothetical protein